jgi:hypothetical protein
MLGEDFYEPRRDVVQDGKYTGPMSKKCRQEAWIAPKKGVKHDLTRISRNQHAEPGVPAAIGEGGHYRGFFARYGPRDEDEKN